MKLFGQGEKPKTPEVKEAEPALPGPFGIVVAIEPTTGYTAAVSVCPCCGDTFERLAVALYRQIAGTRLSDEKIGFVRYAQLTLTADGWDITREATALEVAEIVRNSMRPHETPA